MSTIDPSPPDAGVRQVGPDLFAVTADARPRTRPGRVLRRIQHIIIGPPLPTRVERAERLGIFGAVALIGSDMIASSVYGPEEMMRRLGEAGPAGVAAAFPVGLAISVLLAVLTVSYLQTITAYPSGAGGYIVASDNLGPLFGIIGAAALLIDYTLDVSVSIAAGIQSVTSAIPQLSEARLALCLGALVLITLANLRGIRAAGMLLSLPVYVYILGTLGALGFGIAMAVAGHLPVYTPPDSARGVLAQTTGTIGLVLVLRAFSSGAVALTGVEAISNGVPYLKEPETRNAQRTLLLMAGLFGCMFVGLAFMAGQLGVIADPAEIETVHSQITRTLLGTGPIYILIESAAVMMLILAANTGFADFPRLLALLAQDNYLPQAFSARGSRLAFSNGIVIVAILSGLLLMAFNGSLAGLAPLFTIGAFLTFTISQSGMVRYWLRQRASGWQWRALANGIGAATTAIVLLVVLASKFTGGAWLVLVALPVLTYLLYSLGQHQQRLMRKAALDPHRAEPLVEAVTTRTHHRVLIPVAGLDRVALNAIAHVTSLLAVTGERGDRGPIVEAVHITDDRERGLQMQREWLAAQLSVPLVVLESPYRATAEALMQYLDYVALRQSGRLAITIVLPETLPTRWWHPLLRNYLSWRLKWMLLFRPGVTVLSVPLLVRD